MNATRSWPRLSESSPEKIAAALVLAKLRLGIRSPSHRRIGLHPILPAPHIRQEEVIQSPASRKVIVAGRRSGKTTVMSMIAAKGLQEGKRVLYAGPTAEQTDRFWYAVRHYYQRDIDANRLYKSETKRILEPPGVDENGPRIRAKTAFNADTLRGDWGNLILLDEYSLMDPDVDSVVLPMLLDKGGDIYYVGTPKRKNHFFHKYLEALQDTSGRWAAWNFPSHENPHLNQEALIEMSNDLTEDMYRQEILAEFLESVGAVFRNILANLIPGPQDPRHGKHRHHTVVMGADWGKLNDFTALSVVCADCHEELELDRFNTLDYHFQQGRLRALVDKWRVSHVLAEKNSMGEAIIDQLVYEGVPISGFATTPSSKPPLIEGMALALEREEYRWIDDEVAKLELEAYEMQPTPSGNIRYGAPAGVHDDTVIARCLALRAAKGYGSGIITAGW